METLPPPSEGLYKKGINLLKKIMDLNQITIGILLCLTIGVLIVVIYRAQDAVERDAFALRPALNKEEYERAKLAAEIREIRSNTTGSQFWLKLTALFVTVGGAVGGYLIGQSKSTRDRIRADDKRNAERLSFEHRKDVDSAYQGIVQELSSTAPILRAAAAVKMGSVLQAFPVEWNVSADRRNELIQLTKQVLAAALSIEQDQKVLKTITIALVLHKPWKETAEDSFRKALSDLRGIDLSSANAADAYWAKVDFTYADFYRADLTAASLRNADLTGAQFRETNLQGAVLIGARCNGTNFKMADLRGVDFQKALLTGANFEGAKVYGCNFAEVFLDVLPDVAVDPTEDANEEVTLPFSEWFRQQGFRTSVPVT